MKKIFFGLALAASTVSFAQLQFGAKAGFALSTLNEKHAHGGETHVDVGTKPTFYVGGLVEYKINKLGLQGEVLYTQLGGNSKEEETILNVKNVYEGKLTLHSLLIPVMAKYYIIDNTLSVGAGINLNANLSAKAKLIETVSIGGKVVDTSSHSEDVSKEISAFTVLPLINAEFKLGNGLFFDTRYNFGVMNINKDTASGDKVKAGQWQIGLGYRF